MGDRLRDKVALITGIGAAGPGWGNGKATAVLFAREGARVFGVDVNLSAAEETRRIIAGEGGRCAILRADVGRAAGRQRGSARIRPKKPRIPPGPSPGPALARESRPRC